MGASKKGQMCKLAADWPDAIWQAACTRNEGRGAAWLPALAALAVTGARPASLERGITFDVVREPGCVLVRATVPGAKVSDARGQPSYSVCWRITGEGDGISHRPNEMIYLAAKLGNSPSKRMVIKYDAEAISTRLRELSKELWPKRKYHVSGYCYRELFSSAAKTSGADPEEIAAAMGHLSAESQGKYARGNRTKGGNKPFAKVNAERKVKTARAPMARFKAMSAIKKAAAKK